MSRVLVLDGMWNKSLAVVRSLGKKGFNITAGERTRLATALFSRYCNKKFIYPSPVKNQEAFIDYLENELRRGNYNVVFPMELSTQLALVTNRERFARYCRIPFAKPEITNHIQDKAWLTKFATEKGYEVPKTFFVENLEQLNEIADEINCPALIKPRVSSGSRGIIYVKNSSELIHAYLKVHDVYPLPIIQEYIPDGEGTYGIGLLLNFESEARASFVYKRLRSYPISGGPSTLRESVKREDLQEIAGSLLKSLRWTGIAHMEFKIDPRDGKAKLLEVNPRFWGSLQLAIEAGVDFPYLLYRLAMEEDIHPVKDYRTGVKCRWLIPGDVLHFIKNPERLKLEPSFFSFGIKDDIISLHDPLPTLGRILSGLTFLYDKEMKKLLFR
jgi:predicted ATP-grasp superfamily ATP-dependent carboligase